MEITIDLEDENQLHVDTIDLDIDEKTLAFQIEGRITDLDASILETISGNTLHPTAVTFTIM